MPHKMSRFISQREIFAVEQMLMDSFLLYEESLVANSPIHMISLFRVLSCSILVRVAYSETLLTVTKLFFVPVPIGN